jgi:hypothetical protein
MGVPKQENEGQSDAGASVRVISRSYTAGNLDNRIRAPYAASVPYIDNQTRKGLCDSLNATLPEEPSEPIS